MAGVMAFVWANSESETPNKSGGLLSTFTGRNQILDFMESSQRAGGTHYDDSEISYGMGERSSSTPSYSQTNVQVTGVDELDTVKTDGTYIYLSSWDQVSIIKAYPPSPLENVSVIDSSSVVVPGSPNSSVTFDGIFVLPQKLIVVCSCYEYQLRYAYADSMFAPDYSGQRSLVLVYDISDPAQPTLDFSVGVSGYVQTARMIEDRVYLIAQQYQWMVMEDIILPSVWTDDGREELSPGSIYYDPEMKDASSFLNFLAFDVTNHEYETLSLVAGYASTIYVSTQAIYLTIQKWIGEIMTIDGNTVVEDSNSISTTIFRISFDGLSMTADARGDVNGWLLNQFSMDEKDSYLRLATTNTFIWRTDSNEMSNSVFVLDSDLNVVGSLTGIAPTEMIYSARFVDDKLYLVTFMQVDPLFVIDLKDPTDPRIVGQLEMPGFSNYLHPVDATHVLGIGSEESNVKVSLYDVSNPSNPIEQSKFVLDNFTYSWSNAQYDHKAVMFDLEKGVLVIPISAQGAYVYDPDKFMWETLSYVSGALVLNVSLEDGISYRGIVDHQRDIYQGYEYTSRALYIGDYLYTVSDTILKASNLSDLSEISSLVYKTYTYYYSY